uniref:U6 snRNA-associated Sm-like protein LSm8 n=1 Tax=Glossina palpalis gambiensis TaxID=67801 RepID=A0A1B0BIP1_9MUSC
MASALEQYIYHTVPIITADGRSFIGTLKGFGQTINVILDESHELVFSTTTGNEQIVLHIIRGILDINIPGSKLLRQKICSWSV